jgi:hypothetical protein
MFIDQPLDASQQIFYGSASYLRSLGDHLLTAGLEFRDDRLAVADGPAIGYGTTVSSLYLQDEIPLGDAWTLLGSARIDNHDNAGSIVSPRGALKFDPLANLTMRLMAGSGFKGQALFDEQQHRALHGGLRWVQNNDFGFERSFTLNYDASYSFILGESFGVDANFNAYHTETQRLDSLTSAAPDQITRQMGFTLGVSHRLTPNDSLNVTAQSERTFDAGPLLGNQVKRLTVDWVSQPGRPMTRRPTTGTPPTDVLTVSSTVHVTFGTTFGTRPTTSREKSSRSSVRRVSHCALVATVEPFFSTISSGSFG